MSVHTWSWLGGICVLLYADLSGMLFVHITTRNAAERNSTSVASSEASRFQHICLMPRVIQHVADILPNPGELQRAIGKILQPKLHSHCAFIMFSKGCVWVLRLN